MGGGFDAELKKLPHSSHFPLSHELVASTLNGAVR